MIAITSVTGFIYITLRANIRWDVGINSSMFKLLCFIDSSRVILQIPMELPIISLSSISFRNVRRKKRDNFF